MAIAINGSTNVITGVGVGGLPDGIVDADMLAANAVTAGKLASGVGGKVLQVVTAIKTDTASTTSTTMADTGLSASITPASSSNKILVSVNHPYHIRRSGSGIYEVYGGIDLLRGSTKIWKAPHNNNYGTGYLSMFASFPPGGAFSGMRGNFVIETIDSPSTTSSTTYKTQFAIDYSTTLSINNPGEDTNVVPSSIIVLMEIAA
mgnify:CR=1 FL=1